MVTEELEILLSRYDDPDLSRSDRARAERALSQNAQAAVLLDQYRRLNQHLANLPDQLDGIDLEQFGRSVRQALDAASTPRRRPRRLLWPILAPLAAAAAVLLIVLPSGVLFDKEQSQPVPVLSEPRVPVVVMQSERPWTNRLAVVELSRAPAGPADHAVVSSAPQPVICVLRSTATDAAEQPSLSVLFDGST